MANVPALNLILAARFNHGKCCLPLSQSEPPLLWPPPSLRRAAASSQFPEWEPPLAAVASTQFPLCVCDWSVKRRSLAAVVIDFSKWDVVRKSSLLAPPSPGFLQASLLYYLSSSSHVSQRDLHKRTRSLSC